MPPALLFMSLALVAWWVHMRRVATAYVGGLPVTIEVLEVGRGATLRVDAAKAFLTMKQAARAAGFDVQPSGSRSGFRTQAEQEALRREVGAYGSGGLAAAVGRSPHQSGVALDIESLNPSASNYDSAKRAWLKSNGPSFGWFPVGDSYATTPEPWHWEFRSFS
jgi:LAS superfamily LD-carboxypeptidase LdcB